MSVSLRSKDSFLLNLDNQDYIVERIEIPFREGVELQLVLDGELLRVSDRGLGEHEAIRLLKQEIQKRK